MVPPLLSPPVRDRGFKLRLAIFCSPEQISVLPITGEKKGSARVRGSVHWGCYYATALDIEVDP
jgi:hypothetical protein